MIHYHCSGGGRRDRAVIGEPGSWDGLRSTLRAEEEVPSPTEGEFDGDDGDDDKDEDDDDGDDAAEEVPGPAQGVLHHDFYFWSWTIVLMRV